MPAKKLTKKKSKKIKFAKVTKEFATGVGAYKKRVRGNGSYFGDLGQKYGAIAGRFGGDALSKFVGSGNYEQMGQAGGMHPSLPLFYNHKDYVEITHKEYLGDIISSSVAGGLKIQSYTLSPSDANTFPWLSNLVKDSFSQYRFDGCIFEFSSSSGTATGSTAVGIGSVFGAINYDHTDDDFTSRIQIENSSWSSSGRPSDSFLMPVECDQKMTVSGGLLYVLNQSIPPIGSDPKSYFLGKVSIGSQNITAASQNIGSLRVSYKIRLYKPVMTLPLASAMICAQNRTGANTGYPMGNGFLASPQNCDNIGVEFTTNSVTLKSKRLQTGMRFFFVWYASGNSTASVLCPALSITNGTLLATFNDYSSGLRDPESVETTYNIAINNLFDVASGDVDVVLTLATGATFPTTINSCSVQIYQVCGLQFAKVGNLAI